MKFAVMFPLVCLFFNAILGQLLVMQDFGEVLDKTVDLGLPSQFFQFQLGSFTLGFNLASGAILLAGSAILIAVVAGIRLSASFVGIGGSVSLSETSVSALTYGTVFFGLWLMLSPFGSPLIFMIPLFGVPLYFLLTLFYVIGVLDMMHVGGH